MDWNDAWEAAGEALTNDQNTIFEMSVRLAQLEAENERLQKHLLDCKEAAKWADDMRKMYKRQLNEALGGE